MSPFGLLDEDRWLSFLKRPPESRKPVGKGRWMRLDILFAAGGLGWSQAVSVAYEHKNAASKKDETLSHGKAVTRFRAR